MDHIIENVYSKNGVSYVELSVSVKDLSHPWMYRHLVKSLQANNSGLTVNFLAAFNRAITEANPPRNSCNKEWLGLLRQIAKNELPEAYVKAHLGQLRLLNQRMNEIVQATGEKDSNSLSI